MSPKSTTQPWKKFQSAALAKLEALCGPDGPLAVAYQLSDGMVNLGNNRFVHAYPSPSDHLAITKWRPGLRPAVAFVECKYVSTGRGLYVSRTGEKGKSGLKEAQMRLLTLAHNCGQIGLLLVCFKEHGVWALDGRGLIAWAYGQDPEGEDRRSISLAHFDLYGQALGLEADWALDRRLFTPPAEPEPAMARGRWFDEIGARA